MRDKIDPQVVAQGASEAPIPERPVREVTRSLSRVLARLTILLTVLLGLVVGIAQLGIDLNREKQAVELNLSKFMDSVMPSAQQAVYDFDTAGARQVANGLFTQRAVAAVKIEDDAGTLVDIVRDVAPTLPQIGVLTRSEIVTLSRPIVDPGAGPMAEPIGRIEVQVDRSIVAPEIVDRMLVYFALSIVKNFLLGVILVWLVFRALTAYEIELAEFVGRWRPDIGAADVPDPPKFLQGTEIQQLADRVQDMMEAVVRDFEAAEASKRAMMSDNRELAAKAKSLSETIENRTRELIRAQVNLEELASTDPLTGLRNRMYLDRAVTAVLEEAGDRELNFTVFLADIDSFKAYNDHYGHQKGDACLRDVAQALRRCTEDLGLILARFGGEEFIFLAPDLTIPQAEDVADRIVRSVSDLRIPHTQSRASDHVTVSLGVSQDRLTGAASLDTIIASADEALYQAKRDGRNRYVYASKKLLKLLRRREEEYRDIQFALDNDGFVPFYQPIVDMADNARLVGFEVLARKVKPDGQVSAPAAFFPKAQELGVFHRIDQMILEKALQDQPAIEQVFGSDVMLSFNATEQMILGGNFVEIVKRISRGKIPRLGVEILETVFLDDAPSELMWNLDLIRDFGIEIHLDDFGTGHSSLMSLMRVNPDRVKISREMMQIAAQRDCDAALVSSLQALRGSSAFEIVAEGVETEQQAERLKALGCTLQQGYFHGYPMPLQALKDWRSDAPRRASV